MFNNPGNLEPLHEETVRKILARDEEAARKQLQDVLDNQQKRMKSTAAAAVDTERALKQLGNNILGALLPVITAMTPIMNGLLQGFAAVANWIFETKPVLYTLTGLIGALTAAYVAYRVAMLARMATEAAKDIKDKKCLLNGFRTHPQCN